MARDHGFRSVRISRIIQETADTRTYVLAPLPCRAGQFVTVRACGTLRSHSMSSSPDTDDELMVTVKRVPGSLQPLPCGQTAAPPPATFSPFPDAGGRWPGGRTR